MGDTAFQGEQPRPGGAGEHTFHALPVKPPRYLGLTIGGGQTGDMGIGPAAKAVGDTRQHPVPARGGRHGDDGGGRRAAEGFRRRRVGGIAGLREISPGNRQDFHRAAGGDVIRGRAGIITNQANAEWRAERLGELNAGGKRLQCGLGKRAVGFGVSEV